MVSIERWKEQYHHLAEGPQNDIYIVPQIGGGRVKKKVYQVKMPGKWCCPWQQMWIELKPNSTSQKTRTHQRKEQEQE